MAREEILLLVRYVLLDIEIAYMCVNDSEYESAIAHLERAIEHLKELQETE